MGEILLYGVIAGLANLLGTAFTLSLGPRLHAVQGLAGFASGFLAALVALEVLPESFENGFARALLWSLVGFSAPWLLTAVGSGHWHGESLDAVEAVHASGVTALAVHAVLDGTTYAAAAALGPSRGLLVLVALVLHKIPDGVVAALLPLGDGGGRGAWTTSGLLSVATVAGSAVAAVASPHFLRESPVVASLLAFAGGVLIHVVALELFPRSARLSLPVAAACGTAGVAAFVALASLLEAL